GRQKKEVANRPEVGSLSGLIDKARQETFGLHSHPDVHFGGELRPDAAGAGSRRALADPAAVDHDNSPARAGQVKGEAAAHHAGADDDYNRPWFRASPSRDTRR